MFRRWLSNYLRKNRRALFFLLMIIFVVMVYLLVMSNIKGDDRQRNNEVQEVYRPAETIISGNDVSKEKLESDEEIVTQFVEYCNKKEYQKAYDLISDDCKNAIYPNLNRFKTRICRFNFRYI